MINSKTTKNKGKLNVRKLTTISLLTGITIFLTVSNLGILPIPFLPAQPTILHIPVIIGAIIEGPIVGAIVGLMFGLSSLINSLVRPVSITAFAFWNPIVSILPRILIGITTYYSYKLLIKFFKNTSLSIVLSTIIGTLTNTVLVLYLMYIFYADKLLSTFSVENTSAVKYTLLAIAGTNGIPEAVVSAIVTLPIVLAIKKIKK